MGNAGLTKLFEVQTLYQGLAWMREQCMASLSG